MLRQLSRGDPAPWFVADSSYNPRYHFDSVGGRYVVLCFFGSASVPEAERMLRVFRERRDLFNDRRASFFGVTCDPADKNGERIGVRQPGFRLFWDFKAEIAARYGVLDAGSTSSNVRIKPVSFVLDPNLRVLTVFPLKDWAAHASEVVNFVASLPPHPDGAPALPPAPVLVVPRVFEPEFCRELIALYDRKGGEDSGFMRTDPETGMTVAIIDHTFKRRRDYSFDDVEVQTAVRERVERRLVPEVRKVFQFHATRIERYIVACYDAREGGHFRPHRDNLTKGTAHRRFAVTINLNAEEYEGGDLRFPEYDRRTYRAPTGGAIVFSCSMLHEATPVTRGRRYCVLPFLYDEAAAGIRKANIRFLAGNQRRASVTKYVGATDASSERADESTDTLRQGSES